MEAAADPARDDVDPVEEGVDLVREELLHEGRVVDSVHDDEQLVQRERAAAAHPAREDEAQGAVRPRDEGRRTLPVRGALGEEALTPVAVLEDEVAGGVERAERPEEEQVVHVVGEGRPHAALGASEAGIEHVPPHADGVDLVDEDDALAAPLAGEPLRAAREDPHDDRVDPDEGRGEAGARDRDERRVEAGRERLREHRLARPGRAEEEQAPLPLSPGALEGFPRLPDRDDAADFLLRLDLAPDVRDLHAPLGVARLEGLDLREVHEQQRAEEDQEVEDQEEGEDHEQRQDLEEVRRIEQDEEDEY